MKKNSKTILRKLVIPMIFMVVAQLVLSLGTIIYSGTFEKMNQSAFDVLNEKVVRRGEYLTSEMISRWSNVNDCAEKVNNEVNNILNLGNYQLDQLDRDALVYNQVINSISVEMVNLLRKNYVTGTFIVFNTDYARQGDLSNKKPGLYIQDLDPLGSVPFNNSDILLEIAPKEVAKTIDIAMDSVWQPQFSFDLEDKEQYAWFYKPLEAANSVSVSERNNYKDFGYWSSPHDFVGKERMVISYSVPLILDSGEVYGVMGVELMLDYLTKYLPSEEIQMGYEGSYLLAKSDGEENEYHNILIDGLLYKTVSKTGDTTTFDDKQLYRVGRVIKNKEYEKDNLVSCVKNLDVYNTNTPFENEKWAVVAIVRESELLDFAKDYRVNIYVAIGLSFIIGIAGIAIVSKNIVKPINMLVNQVRSSSYNDKVKLSRVNVREIDDMSAAVEELSNRLFDYSSKLTNIMNLTSVRMRHLKWILKNRHCLSAIIFLMYLAVRTVQKSI